MNEIKRRKRADTPEQKREIIEELFKLLMKYPELRFGQLIQNVEHYGNLYYIEDFDLLRVLDYFYLLREDEKK